MRKTTAYNLLVLLLPIVLLAPIGVGAFSGFTAEQVEAPFDGSDDDDADRPSVSCTNATPHYSRVDVNRQSPTRASWFYSTERSRAPPEA